MALNEKEKVQKKDAFPFQLSSAGVRQDLHDSPHCEWYLAMKKRSRFFEVASMALTKVLLASRLIMHTISTKGIPLTADPSGGKSW
ncbi:hypothetical protein HN011_006124 [Eciton burchellii]|nr:hypothetical protein HN011_006124 [Eciton burchellii]